MISACSTFTAPLTPLQTKMNSFVSGRVDVGEGGLRWGSVDVFSSAEKDRRVEIDEDLRFSVGPALVISTDPAWFSMSMFPLPYELASSWAAPGRYSVIRSWNVEPQHLKVQAHVSRCSIRNHD